MSGTRRRRWWVWIPLGLVVVADAQHVGVWSSDRADHASWLSDFLAQVGGAR